MSSPDPSSFGRVFRAALDDRNSEPSKRRWIYVPYDQLSDRIGPLASEDPDEVGILLIESPAKAARRPYHRQKLAYVLANQRQFALEQAARGVAVDYRLSRDGYASEVEAAARRHGGLRMMEAAEYELRAELAPLVDSGDLKVLPHEGWLTSAEDFAAATEKGPPWRMDAFYRQVRRRLGILMDDAGKPEGGRFSFDGENREPWSGEPPAPTPPRFRPDEVTKEVGELIDASYGDHPGELDLTTLAATTSQVDRARRWALEEALPQFGPFEDAMSLKSRTIFHTRISPLLNLHRVTPQQMLDGALEAETTLASREGFVRQLIGWREFMRHVHRETEGFRKLPEGYSEGGSGDSLPPAYWGKKSGLNCLDEVVSSVVEEGYSHHITRLMILSNLATLLDYDARELNDWFWSMYVDAFDWVVEPNVLGMGRFALGDLFTTKPYVSGANYIAKMSDYCGDCAFHPKKSCPITPLYWSFLARHEAEYGDNQRMFMPYRTLAKRSEEKRAADQEIFERVRRTLAAGEQLTP
jgi:(6-4)DNA photolyase